MVQGPGWDGKQINNIYFLNHTYFTREGLFRQYLFLALFPFFKEFQSNFCFL